MDQPLLEAQKVSVAITSFEHLVSGDRPESTEALARARVSLVKSVNTYIAFLAKAKDDAHDYRSPRWVEAYTQVAELRRRYSEHIARFGAAAIETDWPGYQASSKSLMCAMRDHLGQVTKLGVARR